MPVDPGSKSWIFRDMDQDGAAQAWTEASDIAEQIQEAETMTEASELLKLSSILKDLWASSLRLTGIEANALYRSAEILEGYAAQPAAARNPIPPAVAPLTRCQIDAAYETLPVRPSSGSDIADALEGIWDLTDGGRVADDFRADVLAALRTAPPAVDRAAVVDESYQSIADWCDNERSRIGAVDGYSYESGEEYGIRRVQIEIGHRMRALAGAKEGGK
jgi:hypothetical protein